MSLVVTTAKVKEKAGLATSDYDTLVDNLIADWVPALEFGLDPAALDDTDNTGLQATLNLGATEVVAGELLAQLAREPGGSEVMFFGWLEVRPAFTDLADPFGLKSQGFARLAPFQRSEDSLQASPGVLMGGVRTEECAT